jgi:hypothetical protein
MKKNSPSIILVCITVFSILRPVSVQALFRQDEFSTIDASLPDSYFSNRGPTPDVLWQIPAVLGLVTSPRLSFSVQSPYVQIPDARMYGANATFACPSFEGVSFALGARVFSHSNDCWEWRETETGLFFGTKLLSTESRFMPDISTAIGVKLFAVAARPRDKEQDTVFDPILEGRTAPSVDSGFLFEWAGFRFALSGLNLLPANLGVVVRDVVPLSLRADAQVKLSRRICCAAGIIWRTRLSGYAGLSFASEKGHGITLSSDADTISCLCQLALPFATTVHGAIGIGCRVCPKSSIWIPELITTWRWK